MKTQASAQASWKWAVLLVASDVTALLVVGALVAWGVIGAEVGLPIITAVIAGNRLPAAIRVGKKKKGDADDDEPPGNGALVTGAVLTLLLGAGHFYRRVT